jgi:hypothetical protein
MFTYLQDTRDTAEEENETYKETDNHLLTSVRISWVVIYYGTDNSFYASKLKQQMLNFNVDSSLGSQLLNKSPLGTKSRDGDEVA